MAICEQHINLTMMEQIYNLIATRRAQMQAKKNTQNLISLFHFTSEFNYTDLS